MHLHLLLLNMCAGSILPNTHSSRWTEGAFGNFTIAADSKVV